MGGGGSNLGWEGFDLTETPGLKTHTTRVFGTLNKNSI